MYKLKPVEWTKNNSCTAFIRTIYGIIVVQKHIKGHFVYMCRDMESEKYSDMESCMVAAEEFFRERMAHWLPQTIELEQNGEPDRPAEGVN